MYKVLDKVEAELVLEIYAYEEKGIKCQAVIKDYECDKERRYDVCFSGSSVSLKTNIFHNVEDVRLDVMLIERSQSRIVEAFDLFKKASREKKVIRNVR